MQKQRIEVIGLQLTSESVDDLERIGIVAPSHLRLKRVTVPVDPLQCGGDHLVRFVGISRVKEADPPIVGVANEAGKTLLAELTLHPTPKRSAADSQACDFDSGLSQSHEIRGRLFCRRPGNTGTCTSGRSD